MARQKTNREIFYDYALPSENKLSSKKKARFRLTRETINLEELYKTDAMKGRKFDIDTSIDYRDLDNESKFIDSDSIHSYKFSIRNNDTPYAKMNRFSCSCGQLSTPQAGVECQKCKTYTYSKIAIRGWITLKNFKVFNPDYFSLILENRNKKVSKEVLKRELFQVKNQKRESVLGINILDLQEKSKLAEFIKEYTNPKHTPFFLKNIDKALTSKIPVLNKNFRNYYGHRKLNGTVDVTSHPLNSKYITISKKAHYLNSLRGSESSISILSNLHAINETFLKIYGEIQATLGKDKEADLRDRVGGIRLGSSSRLVLEGALNCKPDELIIPYAFFGQTTLAHHRDLYEEYGLTLESEFRLLHNIPNRTDCIMMRKVLNRLTEESLNVAQVYRPPVIYPESNIALKIKGLSHDLVVKMNEITISACLHGDKDGDVISLFIPNPTIRPQLLFALSPNKKIYNPIMGEIEGSYELVESQYVNVALLYNKDENLDDMIIDINKAKEMKYV